MKDIYQKIDELPKEKKKEFLDTLDKVLNSRKWCRSHYIDYHKIDEEKASTELYKEMIEGNKSCFPD